MGGGFVGRDSRQDHNSRCRHSIRTALPNPERNAGRDRNGYRGRSGRAPRQSADPQSRDRKPRRTAEMAPAKAAAQVSAAAEPAAYMSATTETATVSTPTSPAARRGVSGQSPVRAAAVAKTITILRNIDILLGCNRRPFEFIRLKTYSYDHPLGLHKSLQLNVVRSCPDGTRPIVSQVNPSCMQKKRLVVRLAAFANTRLVGRPQDRSNRGNTVKGFHLPATAFQRGFLLTQRAER